MWFIVAILLRETLAPWPGGKCEFSQDIISLCPYHSYQPTYIRNSVFRSVSKACPLFLSFGIHPSKGPSRGFWETTPPSFSTLQICNNSFWPIFFSFLLCHTLSEQAFPCLCLGCFCICLSLGFHLWPSFNLFVTPTSPRELPNQKPCVVAVFYLIFVNPHHPEDSLKLQAVQLVYVQPPPPLTFHLPPLLISA